MITLHILQLLANNDFGVIALTGDEEDATLFFEKLTLDKTGLYIASRGAPKSRGVRTTQAFDIYSRGADDIEGAKVLERAFNFLATAYGEVCDLPVVPGYSETEYKNVSIQPTSNIENVGLDANNRIIYVISGQVQY